MRFTYATALVDFDIIGKMRAPLEIKAGVFLTNNSEHLTRFVSPSYLLYIGHLEAAPLTNGSPILFKIDEVQSHEDSHVEVINFLREVQGFLTATWLKTDNNVNCELAFAFGQDLEYLHSNSLALQYSHHTGKRQRLQVLHEELLELAEFHRQFFAGIKEQDRPAHTAFRRAQSRIDRGILFLQQARAADDLGQKIANYCSFFEAVLSTSSAELSHQLSERVAFFTFDSPEQRLRTFREVKKAYSVRSKIVHGDALSDSAISGLVDVAGVCDGISRAMMLRVLQHSDLLDLLKRGSNDSLDVLMLELIFGLKQTSYAGNGGGAA
ncbi:MAG: HEPN domain-containing protein [Aromatoleum sp.]|jgi:hypothetical protein|uniref:HEPN domain-containing protein n=1 Tax=Aromatoleum sp. TaxID=2307007 RepID=UPI00289513EE|nr:HEPN domain-containing protein [Aromatoleum sp.]MDT3668954.1 HEPN domain-containing protein [Aromatoleum sp.]